MEHRVSAFSHSPEKQDLIRRLGADYVDSSDSTSLTAHHTTFDLILSTLIVPFDLDACLGMLRAEGRFCFVAAPVQPLPVRAGRLYDYGRRCIYGNYVGSRSDAVRMLDFVAQHDILPAVEVMAFARLNEAIGRVRRSEVSTALVLESSDVNSAR